MDGATWAFSLSKEGEAMLLGEPVKEILSLDA